MEVIVAKHAGFCEGVERAYRIATRSAESGKTIYMLGDIVHNSQVVAKFKSLGAKTIKNLEEVTQKNSSLIISAHGVPPKILNKAKEMNLEIIDTTCSWVKKAQKVAQKLKEEGRQVIILGDQSHPEVEGLKGWAGENSKVIQKKEDLDRIDIKGPAGLIAQTTQSEENFDQTAEKLKEISKDAKIENTICNATTKRQHAATDLAKKVDLMLVVGDLKSANTKRLTELCKNTGTGTIQIETAKDIRAELLKGKKTIGVTAGASTPEWIIKEVLEHLKRL